MNTLDKMRESQKHYDLDIFLGHDAVFSKMMMDYRLGVIPWAVLILYEGKVLFNDIHIHAEVCD